MGNSLSLYVIEDGLAELLEAREQARADLEAAERKPGELMDLAEAMHALQVVEETLQSYFTLEVRKVDNYHRYLTMAAAVAKEIRAEEVACAARRHRLEAALAWLKKKALDAMALGGKKRIDGSGGRYLLRKGDGGQQPLVVDGWDKEHERWLLDPAPLPDEYIDVTVQMPRPLYLQFLRDSAARDPSVEQMERVKVLASVPAGAAIRKALVEGPVPGARLADRGEHLEVK